MRPLGVVVVLGAVIGGAAFLAARVPERANRPQPRPAALGLLPTGGEVKEAAGSDLLCARLAAECGNHLFEKARRATDNRHLLNQAAQHYRACLAHEPTAPDAGSLFADVRARLEQVEQLQTRLTPTRPASKPAEKAPAPVQEVQEESKPTPAPPPPAAPAAKTPEEEPNMVGPDGVLYRRVRAEDN